MKLFSFDKYEEWLQKKEAAEAKEASRKGAEEILKEEEATFKEVKWSEAFPEAINAKKQDRKKEEPTPKAPQNRKKIISSEDLAKEIEAEELEQKVIELEKKEKSNSSSNSQERDTTAEAVNHTGGETMERDGIKFIKSVFNGKEIEIPANYGEMMEVIENNLVEEEAEAIGLPKRKDWGRTAQMYKAFVLRRLNKIGQNDGLLDKNAVAIGGWHDNLFTNMVLSAWDAGIAIDAKTLKNMNQVTAFWADARLDKKAGETPLPDRELIVTDPDEFETSYTAGKGIVFYSIKDYIQGMEDSGLFWDDLIRETAREEEMIMFQEIYEILKEAVKLGVVYQADLRILACVKKILKKHLPASAQARKERGEWKYRIVKILNKFYNHQEKKFDIDIEDIELNVDEIKFADEEEEVEDEDAVDKFGSKPLSNFLVFTPAENWIERNGGTTVGAKFLESHKDEDKKLRMVVSKELAVFAIKKGYIPSQFLQAFLLEFGEGFKGLERFFIRQSMKEVAERILNDLIRAFIAFGRKGLWFNVTDFEAESGWEFETKLAGSPNTPGSVWCRKTEIFDWINPGRELSEKVRYNYQQLMTAGVSEELPVAERLQYIKKNGELNHEAPGNELMVALLDPDCYIPEAMGKFSLVGSGLIGVSDTVSKLSIKKTDGMHKTKGMLNVNRELGNKIVEVHLPELKTWVEIDALKDDQSKRKVSESAFYMSLCRAEKILTGETSIPDMRKKETMLKDFDRLWNKTLVGEVYVDGKPTGHTARVVAEKIYLMSDQNYKPGISAPSMGYSSSLNTLKSKSIQRYLGEDVPFGMEDYLSLALPVKEQKRAFLAMETLKGLRRFKWEPKTIADNNYLRARIIKDRPQDLYAIVNAWKMKYDNPELRLFSSDYIVLKGGLGNEFKEVFAAFKGFGWEDTKEAEVARAKYVQKKMVNGIKVAIPWVDKDVVLRLPMSVFTSELGFHYSQDFKEMVNWLTDLAAIAFGYDKNSIISMRESRLHHAKEAYRKIEERLIFNCGDALIHRRGFALKGRHMDGSPDLEKVLVPTYLMCKFIGWERKDGILEKVHGDKDFRSDVINRRAQFTSEFLSEFDALCSKFNQKHDLPELERRINVLLSGIEFVILRHPQNGCLPTSEVRVDNNIFSIVLPNCISARYTGINGDSDGDIIYVVPFKKNGATYDGSKTFKNKK
jgi:hypothetical protein